MASDPSKGSDISGLGSSIGGMYGGGIGSSAGGSFGGSIAGKDAPTKDTPEAAPSGISGYWDALGSPVHSGRSGKFNSLYPELAGYNEDITSVENIWKGKATSVDYGDIVGAAIGGIATEGSSQGIDAGRGAGRIGFPALRNLF